MASHVILIFRYLPDFYDEKSFSKIATPFTSTLETISLMSSSTNTILIPFRYNGVEDDGNKLVKKLS